MLTSVMSDDSHALSVITLWIYLRHLSLYVLGNIGGVGRTLSGRAAHTA